MSPSPLTSTRILFELQLFRLKLVNQSFSLYVFELGSPSILPHGNGGSSTPGVRVVFVISIAGSSCTNNCSNDSESRSCDSTSLSIFWSVVSSVVLSIATWANENDEWVTLIARIIRPTTRSEAILVFFRAKLMGSAPRKL